MTGPIRVLVADDHPMIRAGLVASLLEEPDIEVVGEATSGTEASVMCQRLQPNVLLFDLNMPGPSPAHTLLQVLEESPATRVLVLTAHDDPSYIRQMVATGAVGYLLKEEPLSTVVRAIRVVAAGGKWFSDSILGALLQMEQGEQPVQKVEALTEQERTLLRMVADNRTDQEIGAALGMAERTVRYHLRAIYDKLAVNSRIEAAVRAAQLGILE